MHSNPQAVHKLWVTADYAKSASVARGNALAYLKIYLQRSLNQT